MEEPLRRSGGALSFTLPLISRITHIFTSYCQSKKKLKNFYDLHLCRALNSKSAYLPDDTMIFAFA